MSRSDSSRSTLPVRRQPPRRSANLPKFKIATFYSTDVELWFNQIETQFDLHQIMCCTLWLNDTGKSQQGDFRRKTWIRHTV